MKNIYVVTPNPTVAYAAEELKKYLRMMMPDSPNPTVLFGSGADGIRLGLASDFGLDTSDCEDVFLDDVLYADCDENGGVIAGSNPRSVLLAVYEYLRRNGCRWLYPGIDGEYIPTKDVTAVKFRYKPSMRYRGICDEGASSQGSMLESIEFYPKLGLNLVSLEFFNPIAYYSDYYNHSCNRLNRAPEPVTDENILSWRKMCEAEVEKRGLLLQNVGHGWTVAPFGMQEWGDPEKRKLPENTMHLMAEVGGKRDLINGMPHLTNVCMSNPEARRRIVKYAADYAEIETNVTHLSINYADGFNHHCECERCRERLPSDWLVLLLNELDKELSDRKIDTRIVFAAYEDTCWAPVMEKLNNPDRYLFTAAIIWRDFTRSIGTDIPSVDLPGYVRNKNKSITDLNVHMTFVKEWLKRTGIKDAVSFDYHFWRYYYFDVGMTSIAKVIYNDVRDFQKNGFKGMIEDASWRSYFPSGFCIYLYARSLFDTSLTYGEILDDYFSHAYGEGYKEIYKFFDEISDLFSYEYVSGKLSEDGNSGNRFAPERVKDLEGVIDLAVSFRELVKKHPKMPCRVQTVSYRLLLLYTEYCEGISRAFIHKAKGEDEEGAKVFASFLENFGKYEIEIERYYDQSLVGYSFDTYSRIFKGATNADNAVNVF